VRPSEPAAKALDAKQPLVLHDAEPSIELLIAVLKSAGAAALCDKR